MLRHGLLAAAVLLLAGCGLREPRPAAPEPAEVRAQIVRLMPGSVRDREGWARDIQASFEALDIEPSTENLCSVLAVTEQESTFQATPSVPGLGRIARAEIDRRAASLHIPQFVVRTALGLESPTGQSYSERLAAVRTEQQLSDIYEDLIGVLPLGRQLFGSLNPVRTGGPMQVSIDFARENARLYPWPIGQSVRDEVFSRRGGMFFGIAHLLGYPAHYDRPIYRYADFNAGWYASRNAAFQAAVSRASGIDLALDGDLIIHGSTQAGATEHAVRSLASRLKLDDRQIRRALERGDRLDFEETEVYRRVFDLAETRAGRALPRAVLPGITLKSPKITRKLTTAWFANRVDERRKRCMARAG
ncbi:DUF1615 domain-containing protein [Stutzerimonas azotifigens]|uniref:DUF1615 domain-containing protein n=1 Tax=Stutzerimonas azotifigens TaxID=291995 RepID=UPI0004896F49|nr:DUF1615 domain-containing protein [Stutzerimonas azotifigens]